MRESTLAGTVFPGLPTRHFGCIVADPPWHFRARTALDAGNWISRRDAEKHYPVMGIDDIKAMPVRELAARDAHLWLWTTGPCLRMAFDVIDAWGFRYSGSGFVWIKLRRSHDPAAPRLIASTDLPGELFTGLGMTTRKNAEFCLLARRGDAKRIARDVREVILAPVRQHSRKPIEAFERIERYCAGPYLDLFSRESRPGWSAFGIESGKFDGGAA